MILFAKVQSYPVKETVFFSKAIGPQCVHVWLIRPRDRRWTLVDEEINPTVP